MLLTVARWQNLCKELDDPDEIFLFEIDITFSNIYVLG